LDGSPQMLSTRFPLKAVLWVLVCLFLAAAARVQPVADVVVGGRIFFIDADCYSRMSRVREVLAHPLCPVRHQEFENYPQGVHSHATAPLDYLVVGVEAVLSRVLALLGVPETHFLRTESVDVAGAVVSPLLGLATTLWLALWARRFGGGGWTVPFAFAVSPILAHGTCLGRPDHQSLLIFLLAVGLGAEAVLAEVASKKWAFLGGAGFGAALWTSLYEPAVLLVCVACVWCVAAPRRLLVRVRIWWLAAFLGVIAAGLGVEGWPVQLPAPEMRPFLIRWGKAIGELSAASPGQLIHWMGWGLLGAPVFLLVPGNARRGGALLAVLGAGVALTFWQVRWGYFSALIFVMLLPWISAPIRKPWLVGGLFFASLWPVAWEWDARLFPAPAMESLQMERRREGLLLRQMAEEIRERGGGGFIAPWWHSPALAYWSGGAGVAGSSHESIGGTVDAARFYLASSMEEAAGVLAARGVRWVVADDPARTEASSAEILSRAVPPRSLAFRLAREPRAISAPLEFVGQNDFFKLFRVE
jgi:hypothetical protein